MRFEQTYLTFYLYFHNLPKNSFLCSHTFTTFLKKASSNASYAGGAIYDFIEPTSHKEGEHANAYTLLTEMVQPSWNETIQYIVLTDTSHLAILKWNGALETTCYGIQCKLEDMEHISFLLKYMETKHDFAFSISLPTREDYKELLSDTGRQIFTSCCNAFAFLTPLNEFKVLNSILLDEKVLN